MNNKNKFKDKYKHKQSVLTFKVKYRVSHEQTNLLGSTKQTTV